MIKGTQVSLIHKTLGYLGLLPFWGLMWMHLTDWPEAYFLLLTYGALITSFLAGTLWMGAMQQERAGQGSGVYAILSNLVMLLSWGLLWLYPLTGMLYLLALLIAALYLIEQIAMAQTYDKSYLRLRGQLTFFACLALICAEMFSI